MGDLVLETKNWPEAGTQMFVGEIFRGDHVLWADARMAGPGRSRNVHGLIGVACGSASGVTGEAMRVGPGRTSRSGTGVFGRGAVGVRGQGTTIGVGGEGGTGVAGSGTIGVSGNGTLAGVFGAAPGGEGVQGQGRIGVAGDGTLAAVLGDAAPGTPAIGVVGRADRGHGVVGVLQDNPRAPVSTRNAAVLGMVQRDSRRRLGDFATAIHGVAATAARRGPAGPPQPFQSFAGIFDGPVEIRGPLTVFAPFPKSAAVRHPDGSHRRLYCLEAPEALFEDVGRARLRAGTATVRLDREFAALIRTDDYHVFVTVEGECGGVYVAARGRNRFTVREAGNGRSRAPFSYRIVAKRRDLDAPRLERITSPVTRATRLEDTRLPDPRTRTQRRPAKLTAPPQAPPPMPRRARAVPRGSRARAR